MPRIMPRIIRLPRRVQRSLESAADALLQPQSGRAVDFGRPVGETALLAPDSVSWRIFKNPIALVVGGIAAVILELAEPAVRTGVWEHSTFVKDPMGRLRRTGMAAMVTVYGPRSLAVPMIQGVVRMHSRVTGTTAAGEPFFANDERLLRWVHATASYGFGEAYSRYVAPLAEHDFDALYRDGAPAAQLYGACDAPQSRLAVQALFDSMRGRLEPSAVVLEFLRIMSVTSAFPAALRWLQPLTVRAAVDLLPGWVRQRLGLAASSGLRPAERWVVECAGAVSERIPLLGSPPLQSCLRLGLPQDYLYAAR
jgi:uncharacterized protein (DUF2236 family)